MSWKHKLQNFSILVCHELHMIISIFMANVQCAKREFSLWSDCTLTFPCNFASCNCSQLRTEDKDEYQTLEWTNHFNDNSKYWWNELHLVVPLDIKLKPLLPFFYLFQYGMSLLWEQKHDTVLEAHIPFTPFPYETQFTWVCVRTRVEAALVILPKVNFGANAVTFFIYFRCWCFWLSTVFLVFPGIIKTCRLSEECKNISFKLEG